VFLHLSVEGDWLRLACRNAVEPVAVSSTGLGMGLAILKHRIEEVKGTFESSVEQGHFSVHCKLPLMV
jgi:signal transduction histidine kinase